ncbi:hypothetical protein MYX82_02830 [Acidobacteria bacterium AH-259-D05]|nr:hypothetical protein [Acidobacteria bacterium AH-259-D05]
MLEGLEGNSKGQGVPFRRSAGVGWQIPLSQYALDWLSKLDRIVGLPWVFVKSDRTRWLDPRGPFEKGKKAIGMDWVTFHDLFGISERLNGCAWDWIYAPFRDSSATPACTQLCAMPISLNPTP